MHRGAKPCAIEKRKNRRRRSIGLCGENRNTGRPRPPDSRFAFRIEKSNRFIKFVPFVCFLLVCGKIDSSYFSTGMLAIVCRFSDFRKIRFLEISPSKRAITIFVTLVCKTFSNIWFCKRNTLLENLQLAKEKLDKSNFLTQFLTFWNDLLLTVNKSQGE